MQLLLHLDLACTPRTVKMEVDDTVVSGFAPYDYVEDANLRKVGA
jgi:hypothetical protein